MSSITSPLPFKTGPPPVPAGVNFVVSFPAPHVLHVALNNPPKWNALNAADNHALDALWGWYESEGSLRCAILGSTSRRAFCAGGDLKELAGTNPPKWPSTGLAGLGKRMLKKPVIAALNGIIVGGAVEMLTNLDVVIAGESAVLSLPEAKRSVPAAGGGIPRLVYLVGRQKAMEWLMSGRDIPSREAERCGLVNMVVPDDNVDAEALKLAVQTAENSPDSIMLFTYGLRLTEYKMGYEEMMDEYTSSRQIKLVATGDNYKEGLRAFAEKRAPKWVDSKL